MEFKCIITDCIRKSKSWSAQSHTFTLTNEHTNMHTHTHTHTHIIITIKSDSEGKLYEQGLNLLSKALTVLKKTKKEQKS